MKESMGLFDFERQAESIVDFSDEKVALLSKLTDQLGDILIKSGFGFYVDHLSQLRIAAENEDKVKFERLAFCPELFGGSGALWEIWIEDNELRRAFEKEFCRLVDHLKDLGIKNERIDHVRSTFKI
jgi:hypothetical protein